MRFHAVGPPGSMDGAGFPTPGFAVVVAGFCPWAGFTEANFSDDGVGVLGLLCVCGARLSGDFWSHPVCMVREAKQIPSTRRGWGTKRKGGRGIIGANAGAGLCVRTALVRL